MAQRAVRARARPRLLRPRTRRAIWWSARRCDARRRAARVGDGRVRHAALRSHGGAREVRLFMHLLLIDAYVLIRDMHCCAMLRILLI